MRKEYDSYYTPEEVADKMAQLISIPKGSKILEPSVGVGNLVKAILKVQPDCSLSMVDIQDMSKELTDVDKGLFYNTDFLEWDTEERFDMCFINPPYSKAVEHIEKAMELTDGFTIGLLRLGLFESMKRYKFWTSGKGTCLIGLYPLSKRPRYYFKDPDSGKTLRMGGCDSSGYAIYVFHSSQTEFQPIKVI